MIVSPTARRELGSTESEDIVLQIGKVQKARVQAAEQTLEGKVTAAVLHSIGVLQVSSNVLP